MLFTLKKCIIIKNTKMLMEITFLHYKMLMEIYRGGRKHENMVR